jgi:hypothetical protein
MIPEQQNFGNHLDGSLSAFGDDSLFGATSWFVVGFAPRVRE